MGNIVRLDSRLRARWGGLVALGLLAGLAMPDPAHSQGAAPMPGMDHGMTDSAEMGSAEMGSGKMGGPEMGGMAMKGALGPYVMSREASGTSWQPDATPMNAIAFMLGDWQMMAHGFADAVYDDQGGRRGASKGFSASMAMLMGQRPVGAGGTWGVRAMVSLDPLMGANGYPLLFATGETADGRTPLIDRQHPHNLIMELSTSYSQALGGQRSVFVYAGLPGEPALGPPAFMHRASGEDIPDAPITHHWLDSTHDTNGVLTAGYVQGGWKVEASAFNGREPDQHRYQINRPALDSVATRLSWNPAPDWSMQVSWGHLHSPEQLAPGVDEDRITASATYVRPLGAQARWATTFAWGRKDNQPGHRLDGFLLESEWVLNRHETVFGRLERVDEDELFAPPDALAGRIVTVTKATIGSIYDLRIAPHLAAGLGGEISTAAYPGVLDPAYGRNPVSFMVFLRVKVV